MPPARLDQLRADVRARAENRPGVYRMRGPSGEVLYVGKSEKVRTRLLEEFRLIKRFRPVFNVEHKRDRSYCFLKLTREGVPRLLVVGQVVSDGADYFGPFRGRQSASLAVKAVSDLLQLRDCAAGTPMKLADQMELFRRREDPLCIRGQVGRCLAPCAGGCTRTGYLTQVEQARAFLNGAKDSPLALLRERMVQAVQRLQFEYAAELRDRATTLTQVQEELRELGRTVERLSGAYLVPGHAGEDRVYVLRRGSVRAERPAPRTAEERRALEETVREVFSRTEPQTLGLRAHEAQEVLLVARWFRLHPEEMRRTVPVAPLCPESSSGRAC
jgi:excinuclease ABC subunit C